jgi:hypothetical protein
MSDIGGEVQITMNNNPFLVVTQQPYKKNETLRQKERRLELRNKHRKTTCVGCHYNFYNFPRPASDENIEVPEDYSCWYLGRVKRGKCPLKRG